MCVGYSSTGVEGRLVRERERHFHAVRSLLVGQRVEALQLLGRGLRVNSSTGVERYISTPLESLLGRLVELALLARRELLLGRLALLVGEAHLCVLCSSDEDPLSSRTLFFTKSFVSTSTSTPTSFRRVGRGQPETRARSRSITSASTCV